MIFRAVPYTPRRPVPWNGWEFMIFVYCCFTLLHFIMPIVAQLPIENLFSMRTLDPETEEELLKQHGFAQLIIRGRDAPTIFLLSVLAGAIVIPIGEEVIFRLLFQGFLEKREGIFRRFFSFSKRSRILRGVVPILLSSAVFAMLHLRSTTEPQDYRKVLDGMVTYLIAYPLFLFALCTYLIMLRGANLADLGIDVKKIPQDCKIAFWTVCFLFPPIYALNIGLNVWLKDVPLPFALDPIPLFFLAVGLGFLYYRTHRIVACILVHCVFNLIAITTAYAAAYMG